MNLFPPLFFNPINQWNTLPNDYLALSVKVLRKGCCLLLHKIQCCQVKLLPPQNLRNDPRTHSNPYINIFFSFFHLPNQKLSRRSDIWILFLIVSGPLQLCVTHTLWKKGCTYPMHETHSAPQPRTNPSLHIKSPNLQSIRTSVTISNESMFIIKLVSVFFVFLNRKRWSLCA